MRTPSGEPPEADTTQIRRLVDEIARAYETGDLGSLDTIYHESATVFEGDKADTGWPSYRDGHLVPELELLSDRRLRFEGIRVRLTGSTAWATCRYALTAVRDGEDVTARGLGTMVFRRFAGRWRLVHAHTSTGGGNEDGNGG